MENERKVVPVTQDESSLVHEARRLEKEAFAATKREEEKKSEKYKKDLKCPMVFYGEEDINIIRRRDELAKQYQLDLELPRPPILIPAMPQTIPPPTQAAPERRRYGGMYAHTKESPPLPEDLKDQFLRKVPTFRDGERLYPWTGNHFRYLPDNEVKARIKTVLPGNFYIPNPTALLSNILGLLKVESSIVGEPDSAPHLVAVQNGVVDLRDMTFYTPTPTRFLTHYLDVPWLGPQPCPVFSEFVNHTSGGDPELAQRLLEIIGYLLVSDYRPKRFVVFQGEGDCGKSVLGNLVASFFEKGDYASLADYQFGERFAMATIANVHLCMSMDLSDGVIDSKAVSVLKQITGDDPVAVEAKGKDAYTEHLKCKILFGTNNPIKLKSRHKPFVRRLLLMPFLYPVPDWKKDRDLLPKLKQERSAILYQALCAYRGVVEREYAFTGEARFGFTAEQIVLDSAPVNSVEAFANQCCALVPEVFTPTEELHKTFLDFCSQNGLSAISDRAAFSRALKLHLGDQIRPDKQRVNGASLNGYRGIQVRAGDANV